MGGDTRVRYKPKLDLVIIEREEPPASKGGLIIPEKHQAKYQLCRGKVIAIGPAVENLRVGEIVLHGKYAGTSIFEASKLDADKRLYLLKEEDIWAEDTE